MALFTTLNGIIGSGANFYNTSLWTGTGATQSVNGLGFSPSFVWIKNRDSSSDHILQNTTSGTGFFVSSNSDSADTVTTQQITSLDSDGYILGTDTSVNNSGEDFVGWAWKQDPTFMTIETYSGNGTNQNVAHGGTSEPIMILIKRTDSIADWATYIRQSAANYRALKLNTANSQYQDGAISDSTNVSIGGFGNDIPETNASGGSYRMISFFEKSGLSKAASYIGNGSSTGTVVSVGFKPKFIMIKSRNTAQDWHIFDDQRSLSDPLLPNTSDDEAVAGNASLIINEDGFQITSNGARLNTNGGIYLYICFR